MYIFHQQSDLKNYLDNERELRHSVGFVPTMGALHSGHLSLIQAAKLENQIVVCSIFVNPTQFNNSDDLEKYPRTIATDIDLLSSYQCDVLYLPSVEDIYPRGTALDLPYDLGYLDTVLEGAFRPGHFQGVAQVVDILLHIVSPNQLYIGQKDYQQCMVIKKLISLQNLPIITHVQPTIREIDGLAKSSRNQRLTEAQRAVANTIYQCLISIQSKKDIAHFDIVKKECWEILEHKGFRPEYIALADANDLTILQDYHHSKKMVALIAAYLGSVRLIDNIEL